MTTERTISPLGAILMEGVRDMTERQLSGRPVGPVESEMKARIAAFFEKQRADGIPIPKPGEPLL